MFRSLSKLKVCAVLAAAALAAPAPTEAQALIFDTATAPIEIACGTTGGASATLPGGDYVLNVVAEASWLCIAGTCATGGHLKEQGFSMYMRQPVTTTTVSVSCRSTGGAGRVVFSKVRV